MMNETNYAEDNLYFLIYKFNILKGKRKPLELYFGYYRVKVYVHISSALYVIVIIGCTMVLFYIPYKNPLLHAWRSFSQRWTLSLSPWRSWNIWNTLQILHAAFLNLLKWVLWYISRWWIEINVKRRPTSFSISLNVNSNTN